MSATNRGGKRSDADFYATPKWTVARLLEALPIIPLGQNWIEPGAGEGAIIRAVGEHFAGQWSPNWTAVEMRPECAHDLAVAGAHNVATLNFLALGDLGPPRFDVAMGNPPFSLAMEFVRKSREIARATIFLLRLDFIGSAKRTEFFRSDMPDVFVLPNRPCFVISVSCKAKCGYAQTFDPKRRADVPRTCPSCAAKTNISTSDSCDYAWCVWYEVPRARGTIRVLNETPMAERVA